MVLSKNVLIVMAVSSILASPVAVVGVLEQRNLRGLAAKSKKGKDDGPVTGGTKETPKQGQQEEDCPEGKKIFMNAGSGGKAISFKRTSQSRRMKTTNAIDTSRALAGYEEQAYYKFGRSLQSGLKYMWEDPHYVDSCFDYDIIIGFAELDETYCSGAGGEQRIFSVDVNLGGAPINIVKDLNVAKETGGCYKAFTVKKTVRPKTKNIQIQFNKAKGNTSDGEPMVSFISIQPQAHRRLGSKCDQENQKELPSESSV